VNRANIGLAVLIGAVLATIARLTFGKAIDYFGLRAVLLPMIVAFAGVTAVMALLRQPYILFVLFFVLWAIVGTARRPSPTRRPSPGGSIAIAASPSASPSPSPASGSASRSSRKSRAISLRIWAGAPDSAYWAALSSSLVSSRSRSSCGSHQFPPNGSAQRQCRPRRDASRVEN